MFGLRVASVCRLLRRVRVARKRADVSGALGARAGVESSLQRRGARIVIGVLAMAAFLSCATTLEFHEYRACHERPGTNLHDPGLVVGEEIGDDRLRHYRFLPDRNRDDERQVIDVTRVNRLCPLVTGMNAFTREPVGNVWDLTERPE